jgi:thiol-disulfide isomerase/thioredoxin
MIQLAEKLAHRYKYYPDSAAFTDHYFSHPDYPSLFAVTDTLDFFGIANVAAKINASQLKELPDQFITLYHTKKGEEYIFVTKKDGNTIAFTDEANYKHKVPANEFTTNWKEIIIAIDENEQPVEKKMVNKTSKQWRWVALAFVPLLLLAQYTSGFSIAVLLYSALSFAGLGLSILLLQEGFGISNAITAKICAAVHTGAGSCSAVLQSKKSVRYKNFTLSDVCWVFFAALSVLAVLPGNNFLYMVPVGALSVPVFLLSVYQQKIVLKSWCALCLGIAFILLALGATALVANTAFLLTETFLSTALLAGVLLLTGCSWVAAKPLVAGYFELKKTDREHKRFKRNAATFGALLGITKKVDTASLDKLFKVEIGHTTAKVELDLFVSPTCGHCHTAFKEALSIAEKHKGLVKLAIYFNVNIDNDQNEYRTVAEIILEQYRNTGDALALLKAWHIDNIGQESFVDKYSIPVSDETRQIIQSHFNWCTQHAFNYSPVIFFNQQLMPEQYSIADLPFFIKEFAE